MFYKKNVPVWERLLRIAGGAVLIIYGVFGLPGMVAWMAFAAAAVMVLSGLFGFCPACALVGRRLRD